MRPGWPDLQPTLPFNSICLDFQRHTKKVHQCPQKVIKVPRLCDLQIFQSAVPLMEFPLGGSWHLVYLFLMCLMSTRVSDGSVCLIRTPIYRPWGGPGAAPPPFGHCSNHACRVSTPHHKKIWITILHLLNFPWETLNCCNWTQPLPESFGLFNK